MQVKKRCFIAINLPQNIKDELARVIDELRKNNQHLAVKWTKANNLHVTLHFLGSIDKEMIERVGECLENLTKKYSQTKLRLGNIGAFPNLENPRVIYVQGKELDGAILESLVRALGKDLEHLGINVNHRPWHPHITLGRVKASGVKLRTDSIKAAPLEFGVRSIEFMSSELKADGPAYAIIKSYFLKY